MKNKFIAIIGLSFVLVATSFGAVISTNITTTGSLPFSTGSLLTSRSSVYEVHLGAGSGVVTLEMFDNTNAAASPGWGTNVFNDAYSYRTNYATNMVTSYIGQNGVTNFYTNVGTFYYSVTNAIATNRETPLLVLMAQPNTVAVYKVDAIFEKGLVVRANTNCTVIMYYNTGQ